MLPVGLDVTRAPAWKSGQLAYESLRQHSMLRGRREATTAGVDALRQDIEQVDERRLLMNATTVVLLIRALDVGGAERRLVQLATGLKRSGVSVQVLTFYDGGAMAAELDRAGVPRQALGKRGRWDVLGFTLRLAIALRRARPKVVYGFLPTSNALLAVLKPLLPGSLVVWGIAASAFDLTTYDRAVRFSYWLERALAWLPDLIISNSEAGRRHLLALGYPESRVVVVPNGIDTRRFRRDEEGRRRVRADWGVQDNELLVGLVARIDPIKDHACFLQAASRVAEAVPESRFVCVGDGPKPLLDSLQQRARALGLTGRLIWAGQREDMPEVFSALDVACSSSLSEGLSNALAEALSCGVPCVGTDVGDTALLIDGAGRVVPPRDPAALAAAIVDLLRLPPESRVEMQARARAQVAENLGDDALVKRTVAAWAACAGRGFAVGSAGR